MRAVVFGAGGQMGRAVAAELAARGWQVTAATRGGRALPPELAGRVSHLAQTGSDAQTLSAAGTFDAVFTPNAMTAADGAALMGLRSRYGRLCVVSTASVHCDAKGRSLDSAGERGFPDFDDPLTEDSPVLPPGPGYSAGKAGLEQALGGAGITLLRPCAIWGIGARHPREWWFVKRLLDGRTGIPVAAAGESVFHTTSAGGLARLAALCLESGADGPLLVADAGAPRVANIGATIAQGLGRPLRLIPAGGLPDDLAHVGHTPWSAAKPFRVSTARAEALGWQPDRYDATTLAPYLRWLAGQADHWQAAFPAFAHYPHDPFDYAAEDRARALLQGGPADPIPGPC